MNIDWIIIKHNQEGVASDEERSLYRQWIEADRAHAAYARQVEAYYDHLDAPDALSEERLQAKLEEMNRLLRQRTRTRRLTRWASVAASVAVLAGAAYFYAQRAGSETVEEQVIRPGRPYAELQLADGKVVILQQEAKQVIASDEAAEITSDNNVLVYTPRGEEAQMRYHVINVPSGAEYEVQLADGTRVFLNSSSQLRFPVTFSGPEREVFLTGEAFFEVARDTARRFAVRAGEMTVVALGTAFNVKAYPRQTTAAATLTEGRVKVILPDREHEVTPGLQVLFDKTTNTSGIKEVNVALYTSWKDGYYSFNQMPLEEIISTLAVWYNLEVSYQDPEVKEIPFSGQLERYGDITKFLDKFESTNEVQFQIQGNHVIIKKK
jgi:ferric-dicitrate binding protein FerR (iron transport regulator)